MKEEAKTLFFDFFGVPKDSVRRARPGIYHAATCGPPGRRVEILLLDTRSFKSPPVLAERPVGARGSLGKYAPNDAPDATLLGRAQWTWLEAELRRPADVRLIASSGQVVADEKGMDEWGYYPRERGRLFGLIDETGAGGVVVLSGNVHFAEISATDEGPYPIVDFPSSGLSHVNEAYARAPNRHRVAGPFTGLNVGLVEIDWDAGGGTVIRLGVLDVDGRRVFEHAVGLADLQCEPARGK